MISSVNQLQTKYDNIQLQNQNDIKLVKGKSYEKEIEIEELQI